MGHRTTGGGGALCDSLFASLWVGCLTPLCLIFLSARDRQLALRDRLASRCPNQLDAGLHHFRRPPRGCDTALAKARVSKRFSTQNWLAGLSEKKQSETSDWWAVEQRAGVGLFVIRCLLRFGSAVLLPSAYVFSSARGRQLALRNRL